MRIFCSGRMIAVCSDGLRSSRSSRAYGLDDVNGATLMAGFTKDDTIDAELTSTRFGCICHLLLRVRGFHMRSTGSVLAAVMLGFTGVALAGPSDGVGVVTQDRIARTDVRVTKNPLEGNRDANRDGGAKFRSRCAGCHGPDARGYIGPDITGLSASGYTDERLFGIVRRGVPGTEMTPADPLRVSDREIWQMLAYLD